MKNVTVMFVDDERKFLNSLCRNLMKEPYRKVFATGPREALGILENEDVQVVASDFRMPGMDGVSFLREVKRLYPNIVRVIFSGSEQTSEAVAAVAAGEIFRFISKSPNGSEDFKETIREAIECRGFCREGEVR